MYQKKVEVKKTLGQKTEDRLMKYILDKQIEIGEKIPNEFELAEFFKVGSTAWRRYLRDQYRRYGK